MKSKTQTHAERWGLFELALEGTDEGNPYKECLLTAIFRHRERTVDITGFYDGNGVYRIRFMPDTEGEWTYKTASNYPELDGITGRLTCGAPAAGNRGPVRIRNRYGFMYEDGTVYHAFGTTCYAWIHLNEHLQERTLRTLASAPFNKIRMCVFPKHYSFNSEEPVYFPFVRTEAGEIDFSRFDPRFFANLEHRILQLQRLDIEADLILFHPYDKGRWGFDSMDRETDDFYLRYVLARLSAFRNVWWSLANEYDFMKGKHTEDWDRLFQIVQQEDPYDHLRSIHNGTRMYDPGSVVMYDHGKPWVTHCSIQHWDVTLTAVWHDLYKKPIVIDECCYEGNIPQRWGNITGEEMTRRFWDGVTRGGYVTHGETFLHPEDVIWWAKGGELHGESPRRIAFLRSIINGAPADCEPIPAVYDVPTIGVEGEYYLQYFGLHVPAYRMIELPDTAEYSLEIIDTWNMTISDVPGKVSGKFRLDLPGKPYQAVRTRKITSDINNNPICHKQH
ncbi:DUF5605 domain-containing protein [Paenibacillus alkalitolerans]|uniref:DUF5605 domain-containing protein n=1 Tax=Paenibacillus alkalitolerans TaxID=2799335 RepID=UPI0018F340D4|nr:DUF5060 domain-containing protein [Paenibacillus alkalitolerans]